MRLSLPVEPRREPGWLRALLLAVLAIVSLALAAAAYLQIRYPTASPPVSASYLIRHVRHPHAKLTRQVVGFLPYWRLDDSKYMRSDLLSEVIYFGLTADGSGQLLKSDPGWRWWTSAAVRNQVAQTQISGGTFLLTVAMQNNKQMESLLGSVDAQQKLIDSLLGEVSKNKLNGLNVDFEYDGKPPDGLRQAFSQFASKLAADFRQRAPGLELAIDLPPTAASRPGLQDVPKLAALFDKVIVMSYDYYSSSSDVAGPVAPISGYSEGKYFFDVTTTFDDFEKVVPKRQLIMGVPYYGWDRPVKDNSKPMAATLPQNDANGYAEIMSYSRMRTDANVSPGSCTWDALAQETWCAYTRPKSNVEREVWIEDDRSIGAKYDFAKSQGLGGVAIWTLGYDGSYPDLWRMIAGKFAQPV